MSHLGPKKFGTEPVPQTTQSLKLLMAGIQMIAVLGEISKICLMLKMIKIHTHILDQDRVNQILELFLFPIKLF